jgi:hypothetical protein
MPRFSPALASDVDLAVVYHWLDGREAVATPPLISLGLKATSTATGDGQAPADTELELIATTTGTAATSGKSPASLRYRVTLANATSPVANRTIHYRLASSLEWSTFTTDERGEAVLNPDHKFAQAHQEAVDANRPGTQLKMRLERGRYALVIEALEDAPSVDPTVVGLATAVVNVP